MRRPEVIGEKDVVKTLHGEHPYIFFDNAASTPTLKSVFDTLSAFMPYYSNVERGIGYKSFVSTEMFERAREAVHDFMEAPEEDYTVIFVKNTTEAINKLARMLRTVIGNGKVLITEMEHHSNLLPWKKHYDTEIIEVDTDGRINVNLIEEKLRKANGKIKLVAITGASNVTGYVNPIYEIADIAHRYGALISIDGAQYIPHKRISIKRGIDFLSFSAHKFYAPFGSGALIGRKDLLEKGEPESVGGGTVKFVALDEVIWADLPEKEEAGTPVIVGAIALMAALEEFKKWGMEELEKIEEQLHDRLYNALRELDGIKILGGERRKGDLPVISFVSEKVSPYLLSSILSFEYGIGVRTGCFCAQPYVKKLLSVTKRESESIKQDLLHGLLPEKGAIRASLSFYNTEEEINVMKEAIQDALSRNKFDYEYDPHFKAFVPKGFKFSLPF